VGQLGSLRFHDDVELNRINTIHMFRLIMCRTRFLEVREENISSDI